MASPEVIDPYLIPGTNVLQNRLGLTSAEELSAAEADLSFVRALQLLDEPVPGTNDLQELMRIHLHLFQDVREEFVEQLAYHYEKINYVHPFREGNGRMQRIYWNRVALAAGWQLDWRPVHGEENHLAARAGSDQQDLGPLIRMFDKVVTVPDAQTRGDWSADEIKRLAIRPYDI